MGPREAPTRRRCAVDAGTMRKRLHEVEVLVRDVRSSVRDDGTLDETLLKQQIASLELVLRFARRSRKLRDCEPVKVAS